MSQVILWAGNVADSSGGGHPQLALGEPDGNSYTLDGVGYSVTLTNFRGRFYRDLSGLLSTTRSGRPVPPADLASADIIAFEDNGGSPARSGGWESCDWFFSDGRRILSVAWDETMGAVRDPHIIANDSISGAAYSAFFEFPATALLRSHPPGTRPEDIVVSFLLFRLRPEIDITSPAFKIRISGLPSESGVRESSPNPDAVGILACHHADDKTTKGK